MHPHDDQGLEHKQHMLPTSNAGSAPRRTTPSIVVFGCGNLLLGDDGFGPAVIDALGKHHALPSSVQLVDAGTTIRDYLFDYLLAQELRPDHILIVDSIDHGDRVPGELLTIDPATIPAKKLHDFSLHQFPTVNLLQELQEFTGVQVTILVAQISEPVREVTEGLSPAVQQAVPRACARILDRLAELLPPDGRRP